MLRFDVLLPETVGFQIEPKMANQAAILLARKHTILSLISAPGAQKIAFTGPSLHQNKNLQNFSLQHVTRAFP